MRNSFLIDNNNDNDYHYELKPLRLASLKLFPRQDMDVLAVFSKKISNSSINTICIVSTFCVNLQKT